MDTGKNIRIDFQDVLPLIKNPLIRRFVERALELAPPRFWTDPCSGTGQWHPPEDQIIGGIVAHTRKAVRIALDLLRFFDCDQDKMYGPLDLTQTKADEYRDIIIAAIVLHDLHKNGDPWGESTHPQHGLIAAQKLRQLALHEFGEDHEMVLSDVADLIETHMGIWSRPSPTPAIKDTDLPLSAKDIIADLIVQLADYWASRKWCPFVINDFTEFLPK